MRLLCAGWSPGSCRHILWSWTPSSRTAPRSSTKFSSPTTQRRYEQTAARLAGSGPKKPVHPPLFSLLQKFEVTTSTRIRDLNRTIARQLSLSSVDGYSIFVKTYDKVYKTFSNGGSYSVVAVVCCTLMHVLPPVCVFCFFLASQLERRRLFL